MIESTRLRLRFSCIKGRGHRRSGDERPVARRGGNQRSERCDSKVEQTFLKRFLNVSKDQPRVRPSTSTVNAGYLQFFCFSFILLPFSADQPRNRIRSIAAGQRVSTEWEPNQPNQMEKIKKTQRSGEIVCCRTGEVDQTKKKRSLAPNARNQVNTLPKKMLR